MKQKQNKQEIRYHHLSGIGGWKKNGKKKKELTLLYQPSLREDPAHSQSGLASFFGQGEWMSARKLAKNSPLVLQ